MRKVWLVARREYLENLRTKTFWIGVFTLPVILVVVLIVMTLIQDSQDTRRYAVLDRSRLGERVGWLSEAIDERAVMPDMKKVLQHALEMIRRLGPERLEAAVPAPLRVFLKDLDTQLASVGDAELEEAARFFASATGPDSFVDRLPPLVPEGVRDTIHELARQARRGIREWWRSLPPKEAEKFAPDSTTKSRYVRVYLDVNAAGREQELSAMLDRGELFAYFVINEDPVKDDQGCKYVSNNLTDGGLRRWYEDLATEVVREHRLEKEGIDPDVARWIESGIRFDSKKLSEEGVEEEVKDEDTLGQMAPVFFVYLLWISIFTIAQALLTNTIEEKSSRIIEVLLSSVSPTELMAGKIFGLAATGLTIVSTWIIFFIAGVKSLPLFLDEMPDIDFSVVVSNPAYIVSFVVYFLLGYLLLASVFVSIGSVCNTLKEAQNLISSVVIILVIPLLAMIPIGQDPNGTLARVLSFIPPFTPFVMMNRAAGPPATWEYVATTALLVVSVAVAFRLAGKVFRVGVLMTGKPPRPLEILRLLFQRTS